MILAPLLADRSGATGIYVAMTLSVVLAAGGMAVDLGRLFTLHTQLQQAADAAALAGAAELDGQANARQRAAAALVTNSQSFADGAADITFAPATFFSSLKPDVAATGDDDARFIQVTVANRNLTTSLMGFVGGPGGLAANAQAVAGRTVAACSVTPLMVCNPEEPAGAVTETPFTANPGQQLRMNAHDGAADQWQPGDFGWLVPSGDAHDSQTIAQWIATGALPVSTSRNSAMSSTACAKSPSVSSEPEASLTPTQRRSPCVGR